MKRVALLLDDAQNLYQQLLAREARAEAPKLGLQMLEPEFAGGSSWTQVESINQHLRMESRPDAIVSILAGAQPMNAVFERVLKAGIPVVLLNRIPDWLDSVRSRVPGVMLAGVAPDQLEIGRIQAQQTLRLTGTGTGSDAAKGGFAMLVTGTGTSAAAVERRRGFLGALDGRLEVQEADGGWSAQGAQRALAAWFRVGADRARVPQIVVCQNDAMAAGARSALQFQATNAAQPALARVPLIGCDGLEQEGRASVRRGELAATVILPATTPAALQILQRYFESGARTDEVVRLPVTSFPELEGLRPAASPAPPA